MKRLCFVVCYATLMLINNAANTKCIYVINQNNTAKLDKICVVTDATEITSVATYSTSSILSSVQSSLASNIDLDYMWLLLTAFLVFAMQIGFAMLEAGYAIPQTKNFLYKNIMNFSFAAISWYIFGYDVAFGHVNRNGFIGLGSDDLALAFHVDYNRYFFEFMYCALAVTIASSAVSQRCSNYVHLWLSILMSVWVYPIIAHWIWSEEGWLSSFNSSAAVTGGTIDFAGCGVVFVVGGCTGVIGSYLLGAPDQKKANRLKQNNPKHYWNVTYQVVGVLIIFFGWLGLNPGRTLAATDKMSIASKVAVTTTIAAVSGGITSALVSKYHYGKISLTQTLNGILAGLVSITASCATVEIGHSIGIAAIGIVVYYAACGLTSHLPMDDPLQTFPIYGCCGIWGLIAAAWFSSSGNIAAAGFSDFLAHATRGRIFSTQLVEIVSLAFWGFFWGFGAFLPFYFPHWLEKSESDQDPIDAEENHKPQTQTDGTNEAEDVGLVHKQTDQNNQ